LSNIKHLTRHLIDPEKKNKVDVDIPRKINELKGNGNIISLQDSKKNDLK